jgi:hypothetical protein
MNCMIVQAIERAPAEHYTETQKFKKRLHISTCGAVLCGGG